MKKFEFHVWDYCEIKRVTVKKGKVWILPEFLRKLSGQTEIVWEPDIYQWVAQKFPPTGPEPLLSNPNYNQLIEELKSREWECLPSSDKKYVSFMRRPKVEAVLVVSYAEAKVKIDKQIAEAYELRYEDPENKSDIHEAKVHYEIWRALTIELLIQIFNTKDIARECFGRIDRENEGTDRRKRFQKFFDTYARAQDRASQRMPVYFMEEEFTEIQGLRQEFRDYLKNDLEQLRKIEKQLKSFPVKTTPPLLDNQETEDLEQIEFATNILKERAELPIKEAKMDSKLRSIQSRAMALQSTLDDLKDRRDRGRIGAGEYADLRTDLDRERIELLLELQVIMKGYDEEFDSIMQEAVGASEKDEEEIKGKLKDLAEEKGLGTKIIEAIDKHRSTIIMWLIEIGSQLIKKAQMPG